MYNYYHFPKPGEMNAGDRHVQISRGSRLPLFQADGPERDLHQGCTKVPAQEPKTQSGRPERQRRSAINLKRVSWEVGELSNPGNVVAVTFS